MCFASHAQHYALPLCYASSTLCRVLAIVPYALHGMQGILYTEGAHHTLRVVVCVLCVHAVCTMLTRYAERVQYAQACVCIAQAQCIT